MLRLRIPFSLRPFSQTSPLFIPANFPRSAIEAHSILTSNRCVVKRESSYFSLGTNAETEFPFISSMVGQAIRKGEL